MTNEGFGKPARIGEGQLSTLLDVLPDHLDVADSKMRLVYVNKPLAGSRGLSEGGDPAPSHPQALAGEV